MRRERVVIKERKCRWCGEYIGRVPLQDQGQYIVTIYQGWFWTWVHRDTSDAKCKHLKTAEPEEEA